MKKADCYEVMKEIGNRSGSVEWRELKLGLGCFAGVRLWDFCGNAKMSFWVRARILSMIANVLRWLAMVCFMSSACSALSPKPFPIYYAFPLAILHLPLIIRHWLS